MGGGWHVGSPAGAVALSGCSTRSVVTVLENGQNLPIEPIVKLWPGEGHVLSGVSAWVWEEEEADWKSPAP